MRPFICISAILLCSPLQATLVLFAPATDGYVLCGDKRVTDVRTNRTHDSETRVRAISRDLAWAAVGNTAFYRNDDGVIFWDTFATMSAVVRTKTDWTSSEFVEAIRLRIIDAFKRALEHQVINVAPNMSLFQTLVYHTDTGGVRVVLTTFFFQPPNLLKTNDHITLLNRVSGWGSGSAILQELWRGNKTELNDIRTNAAVMNFLNEKPRLPVVEATKMVKEIIRLASEHAEFFPNVHVSATADCVVLPRK